MARTKSSSRWLKEHFDDVYVKRAQQEGFRSRAVYKLQEIHERDKLLKPGMTIVDLGAAPGGWSQYAARLVGERSRIVALDILPMDAIAGVQFIQGDFREQDVLARLMAALGEIKVDLILSDMAPNMSGTDIIDQPRVIYLAELALEFARQVLRPDGDLLIKMFQGNGTEALLKGIKALFKKVSFRKPRASRSRSAEIYLLARGYKV